MIHSVIQMDRGAIAYRFLRRFRRGGYCRGVSVRSKTGRRVFGGEIGDVFQRAGAVLCIVPGAPSGALPAPRIGILIPDRRRT